MKSDDRQAFTVAEVARMLGLGKTLVYRMVRTGEIPGIKCGGRWIVPTSRYNKWLNPDEDVD